MDRDNKTIPNNKEFLFLKERGEWNALIEEEEEAADVTCEP